MVQDDKDINDFPCYGAPLFDDTEIEDQADGFGNETVAVRLTEYTNATPSEPKEAA